MTDKDLFEKNLVYSTEFSKYLLDHPELENQIPMEAQIFFLADSDPEMTRKNLEMARSQKMAGQVVLFVHAKGLRQESSRLTEPHFKKIPV